MARLQVALTLGHKTIVRSPMPSRQPLGVDKICQSLDTQAGGQTGRLCCLAQARLSDRRMSHVWWLPKLIYQSAPLQTLKALRDAADTTHWRQYWQTEGEVGKWLLTCLWSDLLRVDEAFDLGELLSALRCRLQNNTQDWNSNIGETWDFCPSFATLKSQRWCWKKP